MIARFKAERDPAAAQADLTLFIPALSVPELAALLRGLRAAPEPVRQQAFALAEDMLEAERWAEVESALRV